MGAYVEQKRANFDLNRRSMMHQLEQHGFAMVPGVLDAETCAELIAKLGPVAGAGRRGLLPKPSVRALARSRRIMELLRPHSAVEPYPVRAIYFDKSPDANWLVSWHQDLTLAVRERAEVEGFGPWSVKEGVPHVQPPVELLERMLTVRLHLDDADESNGALRVLPGSHRLGRLAAAQVQELRATETEVVCAVKTGEALLMRPLLLHASGRSTSPRHRRVVHIEYAAFALPAALTWHEAAC
jgi:hypothetical protein